MEEFIYENQSLSNDICDRILALFNKYTHNSENTFTKKKSITLSISSTTISETNDFYPIKNILIEELEKNIQLYYNKLDNNIYFFDLIHKKKTINNFIIKCYINSQTCQSEYHNLNSNNFDNKSKILTFIWYLNESPDGETDISGYQVKPKKGNLLIFPSEWFFPYNDDYPTINNKYVITGSIYIDT